jgi:pimeloyl-ACP methyl ester carboxylesterase
MGIGFWSFRQTDESVRTDGWRYARAPIGERARPVGLLSADTLDQTPGDLPQRSRERVVERSVVRSSNEGAVGMSAFCVGDVSVLGAQIHYRMTGAGPLLLILQGGAGDADASPGLVVALAQHFTVITYDRRGLSRSRSQQDSEQLNLQTHADDVHGLLAAVTSQPCLLFGCSIGALIGLDLACRYPGQAHTLIAHEPPLPQLLPELERIQAERNQLDMEKIYGEQGIAAAMAEVVAFLGIDVEQDREPDVQIPQPDSNRTANVDFFFRHDAPAVRRYRLDLSALRSSLTSIVPAAGLTSRGRWPHHCARRLAEVLETNLVEFPGGHSGYVLRPQAFGETLRQTLATHGVGSTQPTRDEDAG